MLLFLQDEHLDLFVGGLERLHDFIVALLLVQLLLLLVIVVPSCLRELIFKLSNDIKIRRGNFQVIVLDIPILFLMFQSQLLDGQVLLFLNHFELILSLSLHLLSQVQHLVFVLELDFI